MVRTSWKGRYQMSQELWAGPTTDSGGFICVAAFSFPRFQPWHFFVNATNKTWCASRSVTGGTERQYRQMLHENDDRR